MHASIHLLLLSLSICTIAISSPTADSTPPNILILFCDDLGYGDVQCLNPQRGKIPTPHLDRLASEGMTFTDAHTNSSVCTPTRYGLLTGRYCWRTRLQRGVVSGFKPNLISEDRPTIAQLLKEAGYHTGIIGKWHLNFRYWHPEREKFLGGSKHTIVPVGCTIPDGPLARGFDYYHGFHHAGAMKVVIEGDRTIAHDDPINMLPRITEKSVNYIRCLLYTSDAADD